ncbi:MAG: bifunctional diguanylate cyclase/phosphodiesterase [Acidobacteriota bacterium]|nr:bifunctional diguanylate cyclase/phosphodiesterase [Acidobacteriota bacterium]
MSPEYQPPAVGLVKVSVARQQRAAKRRRTTERLRYLSHYDALTTLPNRAFFRNKLGKALRTAAEYNHTLAVLFLSLDPYPKINETLGPAMGDRLVRCVAKRFKDVMGGNDAVGYWGGDKFVLLLEHPGDESQALEIVQRIKKRIERRFFSFKQEFFLTSSIGIGLFPSHGSTVETLLTNAGAALFEAQECGGNCCRFYAADLNARSLKRFALENRLGRGLQRRQFTLHYQPQVDTGSWRITGAEALIRWEHPELGPIPPTDFIPFAEKSGLIIPIGEWVLREACLQLKKWHASGFPKLNLAINVSARQFQEAASVDTIVEILKETGLDPGCLELELTESALMSNAEHVIKSLGKLKDIGVKLGIDDFGTGFSSLEYLRRLPLDTLKIAQSFVRDASNRDGAALVSSIIDLAQRLRLRVVAEGVETEEQLTFLERLGCDRMQGYLFSRPLPGEQFKTILSRPDYQLTEPNDFALACAAS